MSACVSSKSPVCSVVGVGIVSGRLRDVDGLMRAGLIFGKKDQYIKLANIYDIGISDHMRRLIHDVSCPETDPIGRQYIPIIEELVVRGDEENDPIGDNIHSPCAGIVHRYPDRVLLKITNICAVYCRYCFRREMIGAGANHLSGNDFNNAIEYIKDHKEIWEVILTGGDPLILSPKRIQKIFSALEEIEHVKVIRIHTRIPIANPSIIDDTMLSVFKGMSKAIHIVLHVNHDREITQCAEEKIFAFRMANCSIYSQSVLLNGVNDDASILEKLFKKLISIHVKPYYLHHMDRANGTSHFRVSIKRGRKIMKDLQGLVSGICLPKYMLDIPNGYGKIPINSDYVQELENDCYMIKDYKGCTHSYSDKIFDKAKENLQND